MTDQEIEDKVIANARRIWVDRDVSYVSLHRTYCSRCWASRANQEAKQWCLPIIVTGEALCASCWVTEKIDELKHERDASVRQQLAEADMQMPKEQQEECCNRVLHHEPPKEWRQPKLDVDDFARL